MQLSWTRKFSWGSMFVGFVGYPSPECLTHERVSK